MRVIVLFDLPITTSSDKREYSRFRKFLIKNGFMMMQESVYCKLTQNQSAADYVIENVRNNKPSKGLVQALKITEKQYSRIEFIVGEQNTDILNSDERIVIY